MFDPLVATLQTAHQPGRDLVWAGSLASAGVEDAARLAETAARLRSQLGIEPSARLLERAPSHLVAAYAALADNIERFEAPCIDLSLDAAYGDLVGAPLHGRPEPLGTILHQVAFSLNEGSMKLLAESRFGGLSLPPRRMLCDGPSLFLLTYDNRPALAVWIETPQFLSKA